MFARETVLAHRLVSLAEFEFRVGPVRAGRYRIPVVIHGAFIVAATHPLGSVCQGFVRDLHVAGACSGRWHWTTLRIGRRSGTPPALDAFLQVRPSASATVVGFPRPLRCYSSKTAQTPRNQRSEGRAFAIVSVHTPNRKFP